MIIEIESYTGDKLLAGKPISFDELQNAVQELLKKYDETQFVSRFCLLMGYQELMDTNDPAEYTIDLDTHMVFLHSHSISQ